MDTPQIIGRFELREKLGSGAFGTVHRAFDPQLEREVALKVPRAETLGSPKAVERFLREAKAAAQLRHPHIVPIYDAGRAGETYYIASAFITGRTLASASGDKTVKVWDAATGQELLTLKGHTAPVWSVAFSPDGQRLASASADQTVKVWDGTPQGEAEQ